MSASLLLRQSCHNQQYRCGAECEAENCKLGHGVYAGVGIVVSAAAVTWNLYVRSVLIYDSVGGEFVGAYGDGVGVCISVSQQLRCTVMHSQDSKASAVALQSVWYVHGYASGCVQITDFSSLLSVDVFQYEDVEILSYGVA